MLFQAINTYATIKKRKASIYTKLRAPLYRKPCIPQKKTTRTNSVKLLHTKSIYKNHLHFCILTTSYLRKKFKKISFIIVSNNKGINLTKKVEDLYTENDKTLKEMKEETN